MHELRVWVVGASQVGRKWVEGPGFVPGGQHEAYVTNREELPGGIVGEPYTKCPPWNTSTLPILHEKTTSLISNRIETNRSRAAIRNLSIPNYYFSHLLTYICISWGTRVEHGVVSVALDVVRAHGGPPNCPRIQKGLRIASA